MTHRERVLAAFDHQQPDRVPLDLAGLRVSSIVVEGYERLLASFKVSGPIDYCDRMMRVVKVDDRILAALDTDTRPLFLPPTVHSPTVDLGPDRYRDCWGVERVRLPGTFYYDQLAYPLAGDITAADLARYPWPDPDDPGLDVGLRERLDFLRRTTDCAVVLTLPAPFVHISQYLRGFEDWYMDFLTNPGLLENLFDRVLEINLAWARRELLAVGREVDVIICSDDLGTQSGLQVSREHFCRYLKPRLARFFGQIHALSPAKLLLHSCGSVAAVLDDLIEIGVEGLNPVQTTAAGMEPAGLKQKYRGRLLFWGAMDTQRILPHGSVADVKRMVEERIEQLGEGGGYVLAPCHNLQPDVPVENIRAMYEHAREYVPSYLKG